MFFYFFFKIIFFKTETNAKTKGQKRQHSHRVPECLPVPGSVNCVPAGSGTFNNLVNVKAPEMENGLKIVVVVDSREKSPLSFSLPSEKGTLLTGDYSIRGLEKFVAIERKSAGDLVGCLKNGQRRLLQSDEFQERNSELDGFQCEI